jgi:CBS domain-containing protein
VTSRPPDLPPDASVGETVEALIRHRLSTALGGWRGSVETALPTVVFVVVWTWRHDVTTAAVAALAVALVLAGLRVVQRSSLQHVFGAAIATGVAAVFAVRSGRAEDAFLPGILTSAAFLVGTLVSVVTRWPVVGFLVGAGDPRMQEDPFGWRRDRGMVRVCIRLTWVLVAVYVVRLVIMVPLYLGAEVALLGIAKIVLGWPLWVAGLAVMGWMLVSGHTPLEPGAGPGAEHSEAGTADPG